MEIDDLCYDLRNLDVCLPCQYIFNNLKIHTECKLARKNIEPGIYSYDYFCDCDEHHNQIGIREFTFKQFCEYSYKDCYLKELNTCIFRFNNIINKNYFTTIDEIKIYYKALVDIWETYFQNHIAVYFVENTIELQFKNQHHSIILRTLHEFLLEIDNLFPNEESIFNSRF